jgi:isopenicillin N synthase-like dioxygenase
MSSLTLPDNQGNAAISVVDFSPFLDGSNKQGVADEILSSFKRVGFVYLLNHGLPQERITKMFAVVSRALFARSD